MVVEQAKSYITEMRLQNQMLKEENERLKNTKINLDMPTSSNAVAFNDVGVGTSDNYIAPTNSNNQLPNVPLKRRDSKKLTRVDSVDRALSLLTEELVDERYVPLRHTVFSFIIDSDQDIQSEFVKQTDNTEFKTFNWLFPKICTIFITVLNNEDPSSPFRSFDHVISSYISKIYQTSFLTQKMTTILVQSAHIIDSKNYIFKMFNKFLENEYDFTCFRFFHTMLEFSIAYAKPDVSTIVANESLNESDSMITILPSDAISVHQAVFPFWEPCEEFTSTDYPIDYWEFLDILVQDFIKARKHIGAFIKNGLLLSGNQDIAHVTLKNFLTLNLIAFPDVNTGKVKDEWHQLLTRYEALGHKEPDSIDNSSIIYYCVSKDSLIIKMMRTNTIEQFSQMFFDMNAPMLEALNFIIKRLTIYIPALKNSLPNQADILNDAASNIRNSLYLADISGTLGFYRKMLHQIDSEQVNDFSSLIVSNQSADEDIKRILKHLEERETVVGVTVL
ncbi:hypothetical protein TVAG_183450 [Trichomonas vaginalis G3]|uniref:Uncharacterized protein n=1 Tax=Trichomonas vaginalis (strain ATCC PRA-98 / G3) TaxID=412133 RepID=A2D983_TRIV3|nr:hypothetical protein TVAGG3_0771100 [Trichomonas vaginalis G3]EAY23109.1 hypothetical protein TVAG_183450 [Trichomonas vaginalis G3]KAI5513833.1 hypothetical protein TVAGG3_0771100 [Trichomonas vaginalis G3]|eukprot:XP_001584095.1 hypothetical protein [Trichomonas vaginalis G3]